MTLSKCHTKPTSHMQHAESERTVYTVLDKENNKMAVPSANYQSGQRCRHGSERVA